MTSSFWSSSCSFIESVNGLKGILGENPQPVSSIITGATILSPCRHLVGIEGRQQIDRWAGWSVSTSGRSLFQKRQASPIRNRANILRGKYF